MHSSLMVYLVIKHYYHRSNAKYVKEIYLNKRNLSGIQQIRIRIRIIFRILVINPSLLSLQHQDVEILALVAAHSRNQPRLFRPEPVPFSFSSTRFDSLLLLSFFSVGAFFFLGDSCVSGSLGAA